MQARLAVIVYTTRRNRLGAVHAQRATLCERLAAAAAGAAAGSVGEVAASLEDNFRAETFTYLAAILTLVALEAPAVFSRVRRGQGRPRRARRRRGRAVARARAG
jgi:hypothetical protein